MNNISIDSARNAAAFAHDAGFPRRMDVAERLRFVAVFSAAVMLTLLASIVVLPFAVYGLLARLFGRRR